MISAFRHDLLHASVLNESSMTLCHLQNSIWMAQAQQAPADFGNVFQVMIVPVTVMIVLYIFLMIRPESTSRSKRTEFLNSLKKNDPIVTIHGIFGTIANISPESDEVTIRVDDNTRIRMKKSVIEALVVSKESSTKTT